MDSNTPTAEKFEVAVMCKDAAGNPVQRRIEGKELQAILEEGKVFEAA